MEAALRDGGSGIDKVRRYLENHVASMVGDRGPVAILSEIPSLTPAHRDEILDLSRRHSAAFEVLLAEGIGDGSIRPCDIRMTGNAIMGAINWIPKWFHGDALQAKQVMQQFPRILSGWLESARD
jgi:hypothetical protein